MSSIVVSGDTSGAVTLSAPAVAGTVTVTLPAASGTMASLASVTANGVTYVNSSSQPTSGSALVFDGTKLTSSASGAISGVFNRNTSSGATLDIQVVGGSVGTLGSDTGGNGRFDIVAATALQLRAASSFISFDTNGSTRMTLDASGNLLVGTTSKFAGGIDGLDLNTTGETGITFGKSGVVKNYFYLITNESAFQWQTVSGVAVNIISSTNGVTLANGGTSWGSLSDERKKDIIEPITDATTKVSGLRAVIGKYKTEEDGIRRAMLIAQDVQAVLPEAVTENADGDLILQYTDTIPLLVAAIKEQTALITTLTARITALESA